MQFVSRPTVKMTAKIPVVSFAPFLTGSKQAPYDVAKQVYDAFSTIGFIYLKDHGIPQSEIDAVFKEVCKHESLIISYFFTRSPTLPAEPSGKSSLTLR